MKKFTTLCLGILVALSTVAAPVKFAAQKTVKNVKLEAIAPHARKAAPKAPAQLNGETIVIEANNLSFYEDSYYGYSYGVVYGSNDEWQAMAYLYPTGSYYTTYSTAAYDIQMYVYDVASAQVIELTVSAAEYAQTADGDVFTATGTDEDGNTYQVTLRFVVPDEVKETVNMSFPECTMVDYLNTEYGIYMIMAEAGDTAVQLAMLDTPEAGSYTTEDFDTYYTGIFIDSTAVADGLFTVEATITDTETGKNIVAEIFAMDTVLYHIEIIYTKPVADKTETVNFTDATFYDYRSYDGTFQVIAAPADSSLVISLTPASTSLDGTFDASDLDQLYSFVAIKDAQGQKEYFTIAEAEFTTAVSNGIMTWTGWILASNNTKYEFTITCEIPTEGIENTEAVKAAAKVIRDGQLVIEKNGVRYNAAGATLK